MPGTFSIDKIQVVSDRFVAFDCLEPCSCQTREFALITRANGTAGNYMLEVEYCYEGISLATSGAKDMAKFDFTITED